MTTVLVRFAEIQPGPCTAILSSDLSRDVGPNELIATFDDALAMAATITR